MSSPFIWKSRVRFQDTDATGRLHFNSIFLHFEEAEEALLQSAGLSYAALMGQRLAFPRTHSEAQFSAPIRFGDEIQIEVYVTRVGNASFSLSFVCKTAEAVAARGLLTSVCISTETDRPHPLPSLLAEMLRKRLASSR